METSTKRLHINQGSFAIDIRYMDKEFYALVVPSPAAETSKYYQVFIPWLLNFKLARFTEGWKVLNGDDIDDDLLNAVGSEISFISSI